MSDLGLLVARIELDARDFGTGAKQVEKDLGLVTVASDRAATSAAKLEDAIGQSMDSAVGSTRAVASEFDQAGAAAAGFETRTNSLLQTIRGAVPTFEQAKAASLGLFNVWTDLAKVTMAGSVAEKARALGGLAGRVTGDDGFTRAGKMVPNEEDGGGGMLGGMGAAAGAYVFRGQAVKMLGVAGMVAAAVGLVVGGMKSVDSAAAGHMKTIDDWNDHFAKAAGGPRLAAGALQEWTDIARSASRDGRRSFDSMAEVLGTLDTTARKSFSSEDRRAAVKASVPNALDLASMTGISDTKAVELQDDLLTTYHLRGRSISVELDADYQQALNDAIATAAKVTDSRPLDIATSLKAVGPAADAAGWDLRQATAAVSGLAAAGGDTKAQTEQLAKALPELQLRAHSNADTFKELGLSVLDARGGLLPMTDIVAGYATATNGLNDAERAKLATDLGLSDANRKLFDTYVKNEAALITASAAMDETRGAAGRMSQELEERHSKAWEKIGQVSDTTSAKTSAIWARMAAGASQVKDAVLGPIVEFAADAYGGAMSYVDAGLDKINEGFDSVAEKWTGLRESIFGKADKPEETELPQGDVKLTADLSAAEKAGTAEDQRAEAVTNLSQHLRDLDAVFKSGGMTQEAYGKASRVTAEQLDSATGGTRQRLKTLSEEIELLKMATQAERDKAELMRKGASGDDADRVIAEQGAKAGEKALADLLERESRIGETPANRASRELSEVGASQDYVQLVDAERARVTFAEERQRLEEETAALGRSEAEQFVAKLQQQANFSEGQIVELSAIREHNRERAALLELEKEIRKLKGLPDPAELHTRDVDAARAERDRLKADKDDTKKAQQLAEQYDPTIKLREEREELERLHNAGKLTDDIYGKGVASIEERWKKATGAVKEHRDALNRGLEGTAAYDLIFKTAAGADRDAGGPQLPGAPLPGAVPPLPAPAPLNPPAGPGGGAGASGQIEKLLGELVTAIREDVVKNTRDTARFVEKVANAVREV